MTNQNQTTHFTFPTTGNEVRIVDGQDGEPWFVAADVCRCLGITSPKDAYRRLDEDEKDACSTRTPGGNQKMKIVSESGLYGLIMQSRKPEAKEFQRWVRKDVLPAIRKDGGYLAGEEKAATGELTDDEILTRALEVYERKTARLQEEKDRLQEIVDHRTVAQFVADNGIYMGQSLRGTLGQVATSICKEQGVEFTREPRTVYRCGKPFEAHVHRYPVWVLDAALERMPF